MPDFSIRQRVKYGEEWDWEETRAWMKEVGKRFIVTVIFISLLAKEQLLFQTQEAWTKDITKRNKSDYNEYKTKQKFSDLEECIAINLFSITVTARS